MKICFLTASVFGLGGVQRVTTVIANELSKNNEVDIVCVDDRYKEDRELYNLDPRVNVIIDGNILKNRLIMKLPIRALKKINESTNLFNKDKYEKYLEMTYLPRFVTKKVEKLINDNNYDVVIGVEGYFSILLAMIKEKISAKAIGWQHNSFDIYFNTKGVYYQNIIPIFKRYIGYLDQYVVLTKSDAEKVKEKFKANCITIYNPLSFESVQKSSGERKSIISVGRLVEKQKGWDLLIRAFKIVAENNKEWILEIVGDGPDKKKIEELIDNLKLNERVFLRKKTNNVIEYYLNSAIYVSSSRWEGFGLTITEAMECGLPVIAFDNSGPREIINKNDINGVLVKSGDVDKLAEEILRLINNKELRSEISTESVSRAKDFNIDLIIQQWNKLIDKENE